MADNNSIDHLDWAPVLLCGVKHTIPNDSGKEYTLPHPCERPAAWLATLHSCSDRYKQPGDDTKGVVRPVCQWYVDRILNAEYEMRCVCGIRFTNPSDRIWDAANIRAVTTEEDSK